MNELMNIEIIEVTPAVIKFNKSEIIAMAEETAAQYKGLVFTDETVKDGKKTVAELRKIVKNVNDFKIKTKKDLTESVTAFENDCKEIIAKFDEPIAFISSQCEVFEVNRIAQKTAFVKLTIQQFYELHQIDTENQTVQIRHEWLNATAKDKDIESGIMFDIVTIKSQQDKRKSDIKQVEMLVKLQNHEQGLNVELSAENYIRMLSYKSIEDVEQVITQDAQANKQKEVEFAARIEREAQAKAQREIDLANAVAQKEIAEVQEAAKEQIAQIVEAVEEMTKPVEVVGKDIAQTLRIEATKEQWQALSEFMDRNNIKRSKVV